METSENHVHELLKSLRRVSEAEGHVNKLKEPKRSGHSVFVDISGFDRNLMIRAHQIQLRKDGRCREGRRKSLGCVGLGTRLGQ